MLNKMQVIPQINDSFKLLLCNISAFKYLYLYKKTRHVLNILLLV